MRPPLGTPAHAALTMRAFVDLENSDGLGLACQGGLSLSPDLCCEGRVRERWISGEGSCWSDLSLTEPGHSEGYFASHIMLVIAKDRS